MGHYKRTERMFEGVVFRTKTTPELRRSMTEKVAALRQSIEDRNARMLRIRKEHGIDAERLAVLVMRYREKTTGAVSYDNQGQGGDASLIPAGVIANLVREQEMSDNEHDQIRKLELVLRNLNDEELYHVPETGEVKSRAALHELEDEELEYLGF